MSEREAAASRDWLRALLAVLETADELRLSEPPARPDDDIETPTVLRGAPVISGLLKLLELSQRIGPGSAPVDAPRLEFRRAGRTLVQLVLVHGRVLHWAAGEPAFARLTDLSADAVCAWLASKGFGSPREALEHARRREGLWDAVVDAQAAQLPAGAPEMLWESGHDTERQAALVALLPDPLARACACLRVLGAAHPEWFVGLPLDRLIEPWLHDAFSADVVAMALHRVWLDPVGLAGAVRWLVHGGGAEALPPSEGVRIMPGALHYALQSPVARNRTEALEMLDRIKAQFVTPMLHEVFADEIVPREPTAAERAVLYVFSDPETFYLEDGIVRGTSDRAYAALLLARRGEASIRERVRTLMDSADTADFHALALALEALEELE